LSSWFFGPRKFEVLLVGEEGSGKTTFISQLKDGKSYPTNHTTVEHPSGYQWRFWEVGGVIILLLFATFASLR
jgi:GTPase SAR1 family protein